MYKKYDQNILVHFSQIEVNSKAFIYRNVLSGKNPSALLSNMSKNLVAIVGRIYVVE